MQKLSHPSKMVCSKDVGESFSSLTKAVLSSVMSCGCFHGLGENFGKLIAYCAFRISFERGWISRLTFLGLFWGGKPKLPLTEENVEKLAVKLTGSCDVVY